MMFLNFGCSIEKVIHTLIEAFIWLVCISFLGDWRSTIIPAIAVPVSLVGTFYFINFDISLNLITLFALVLLFESSSMMLL
jgi:HAE1 family hydrophobic/amphiphilic exporter-1